MIVKPPAHGEQSKVRFGRGIRQVAATAAHPNGTPIDPGERVAKVGRLSIGRILEPRSTQFSATVRD